jgi:hypothetical protein
MTAHPEPAEIEDFGRPDVARSATAQPQQVESAAFDRQEFGRS